MGGGIFCWIRCGQLGQLVEMGTGGRVVGYGGIGGLVMRGIGTVCTLGLVDRMDTLDKLNTLDRVNTLDNMSPCPPVSPVYSIWGWLV